MDDGAGDEFLTGPAFATNRNSRVAVGNCSNCLIHALHGFTAPDEPAESGLAFGLLNDATSFNLQRSLFDRARQHDLQFLKVERRKKKFVGARLA